MKEIKKITEKERKEEKLKNKEKKKEKNSEKEEKEKTKLKGFGPKKKKEKKYENSPRKHLTESLPLSTEEKHLLKKRQAGRLRTGLAEKKEEVHFIVDNEIPNKLTRNSSLPDLLHHKNSNTKKKSRDKSPRRTTREVAAKSHLKHTEVDPGGGPAPLPAINLEKIIPTTERQRKIEEVWLKFGEIYTNTIALLH